MERRARGLACQPCLYDLQAEACMYTHVYMSYVMKEPIKEMQSHQRSWDRHGDREAGTDMETELRETSTAPEVLGLSKWNF